MKPSKCMRRAVLIACLCSPVLALAQSSPGDTGQQAQQPLPSGGNFLGLGIGVLPKTSGSAGLRTLVLPAVQYSWGNTAYVTGLKAGLWAWRSDDRTLRLGLYAEPRFGYDAGDSSRTAGMADRDTGIDVGPSVRWTTPVGVLNFDYGFDVSGKSHGQVAQLQFIRPLITERGFRLNGIVGATWQNAAMNDYYWGVGAAEATGSRPSYRAGAGTALSVGVSGLYSTSERGAFFYGLSLNRLSDAQADSPITERRYTPLLYLGYGWRL